MISKQHPDCFVKIEQEIGETAEKQIYQTTAYTQYSKDYIKKSEYEKLEQWMKKLEMSNENPKMPVIKNEGVVFNDGLLENSIKQKMYYNKENQLRKKFEDEHKIIYGDSKQQNLQDMVKKREIFKVKTANIMFYSNDQEKQVERFQQIIDDVINEVQQNLAITTYVKYNRRNYMRRDQKGNLLDYALFIFESEQIAKEFINVISEIEFNSCTLGGEILQNRF